MCSGKVFHQEGRREASVTALEPQQAPDPTWSPLAQVPLLPTPPSITPDTVSIFPKLRVAFPSPLRFSLGCPSRPEGSCCLSRGKLRPPEAAWPAAHKQVSCPWGFCMDWFYLCLKREKMITAMLGCVEVSTYPPLSPSTLWLTWPLLWAGPERGRGAAP